MDSSESISRVGAPEIYTKELADKVCSELALGKSLRTVTKDKNMPSMATVFRWFTSHPEFRTQYDVAKQESADAMGEEIIEISDDGTNDWMEDGYEKGKTPGWHLNGENIQRSKLRVDTRKFLMAKMKPKKYGDKLEVESSGEITHKYEELTDEELDRAIKARQDRLSESD